MRVDMENDLKVLAIDTAMSGCNVCVYGGQSIERVSTSVSMNRGQAEALVPLVNEVMGRAGLAFDALDLVVTTVGPGAFTGLRIGMSAAQSFGLALGISVVGVTTLEVLARQYFDEHSLVEGQKLGVLIETKRSDFYFQAFDFNGKSISDPQAISAQEIVKQVVSEDMVFIGDALERFRSSPDIPDGFKFAGHEVMLPDPYVMAQIGAENYDVNGETGQSILAPLYLRPADVSKPKSPPRTLED